MEINGNGNVKQGTAFFTKKVLLADLKKINYKILFIIVILGLFKNYRS
jgi:hypothetical protein